MSSRRLPRRSAVRHLSTKRWESQDNMSSSNATPPGYFFESYKQLDIQSTLNFISTRLEATVYIEDTNGNLLFASRSPVADDWRTDFSMFSAPSNPEAGTYLNTWAEELPMYSVAQLPLVSTEHHVILPLTFRGQPFAFVHLTSRSNFDLHTLLLEHSFLKEIGDKIYMVMIGELYDTASHSFRMEDLVGELENHIRGGHFPTADPTYVVLAVDFQRYSLLQSRSFPLDYQALGRRAGKRLVIRAIEESTDWRPEAIRHLPGHGVFIHGNRLGILIALHPESGFPDRERVQRQLDSLLGKNAAFRSTALAVSSEFKRSSQLAQHFDQAVRVLDLGKQRLPLVRVYSSVEIGLHELLMPLFSDQEVQDYARRVLAPLEQDKQLIDTLALFLQENTNVVRTAERMYLTRRSVSYRLERIRKALGMDLGNSETVFLLHFCLRVQGRL
jgi:purine catabolism regulator